MPKTPMTADGCANALVDVIRTVPGIGLVYPQRHIVRTEQDVQKWLLVESQRAANGWFVTLAPVGTSHTQRGAGHNAIGMKGGNHNDMTTLAFQIEGYYSIQDDSNSELTFRNLTFNVMNEINAYGLLAFAETMDVIEQSPANIQQCGYANFANMFYLHYSNISVAFTGRCQ